MDIPVLNDLVQGGIVGICIGLIIAICYIVRLFVLAIKEFQTEIRDLNKTITELGVELRSLTQKRQRKRTEPISE
ncbi:MAG: hypothetical protein ACRC10_05875 [Thermoguttaceae bacterium]